MAQGRTDPRGTTLTGQGSLTALNVSTATVVKSTAGRLARINVLTAGTAPGTANDCTTTAAAAAANAFFEIPNVVGSYLVEWPCLAGIVVVPGTGQVLAVSFD